MKYILNVEESENGELYIQLPDRIINELDLKENDNLIWTDLKNGSWSLKKGNNNE